MFLAIDFEQAERPGKRARAAWRASQLAPRFDYRALFSRSLYCSPHVYFTSSNSSLCGLSVRTLHSACKVRQAAPPRFRQNNQAGGNLNFITYPSNSGPNKNMTQGGSLCPTSWVHLGVNLARSLLSRSLRAMNSFDSTTRGDAVGAMRDECPSIPENGRRFPIPRIGRGGEQPVSVVAVDRAVGETPRRKGASRNWIGSASSGSDHAKRRHPKLA